MVRLQKFLLKVSKNFRPETVEFPKCESAIQKKNSRKSRSKVEWKPPQVILFFGHFGKYCSIATSGSCRKFKPDVLIEWKAPGSL